MNPISWFEIYVKNMQRAKKFYETVLKVKLESLDSQKPDGPSIELWAFPMKKGEPGASGALVHMQGFTPGGNGVIVYFNCEDCSKEAGRVEIEGGMIHKQKFSIGQYGYIALGYDTEGNMFGLHSMK